MMADKCEELLKGYTLELPKNDCSHINVEHYFFHYDIYHVRCQDCGAGKIWP